MGGSSFDLLLEEVQQLQQVLEELERTNRELRNQLTNLRMGHGIVLDIAGKHYVLASEAAAASSSTDLQSRPQTAASAIDHEAISSANKTMVLPLPELIAEERATQAPSTASLASETQEPAGAISSHSTTNEEEGSFLEEIMYDEFANQMTSPMSVWNGPVKKPETPDEAQKAVLRRELMGSFLLE